MRIGQVHEVISHFLVGMGSNHSPDNSPAQMRGQHCLHLRLLLRMPQTLLTCKWMGMLSRLKSPRPLRRKTTFAVMADMTSPGGKDSIPHRSQMIHRDKTI